MKKRSYKLLIYFLIFSLLLPSIGVLAASSNDITSSTKSIDSQALLQDIITLQKEMSFATKQAYINKLEGKSTESQTKIIEGLSPQIDQLSTSLALFEDATNLSLSEANTLLTLFNALIFLKFMQKDLLYYLQVTDGLTSYQTLASYIKSDSLLSQILMPLQEMK